MVTKDDGMNIALSCDSDELEDCQDEFEKLQDDNKIDKNCSFTPVYDRNIDKVNMAVKKSCIK